jgi:RNA polymerase sigma-70 factor, ECF subfamily
MPQRERTTDWPGDAAPSVTSTSLLQRVKEQEPDAWERLVRLYGPLVFLWCRQAGLSREDAADVVQEVWAAVSTHIDQFRREQPGDSFRGWLYTIARNKVRDRWRDPEPAAEGGTQAGNRLSQIPDAAPDLAELAANDKQVVLQQALQLVRAEFEERTWKAFWRLAVDGRSAAEAAEELEMTAAAVYQAKHRVLYRLRAEMDGLLD